MPGKSCARVQFLPTDPTDLFMKQNDTQKYGAFLRAQSTERLEGLLSKLLREMRNRDSEHMKKDAITTSQALRTLRSSQKIA